MLHPEIVLLYISYFNNADNIWNVNYTLHKLDFTVWIVDGGILRSDCSNAGDARKILRRGREVSKHGTEFIPWIRHAVSR